MILKAFVSLTPFLFRCNGYNFLKILGYAMLKMGHGIMLPFITGQKLRLVFVVTIWSIGKTVKIQAD